MTDAVTNISRRARMTKAEHEIYEEFAAVAYDILAEFRKGLDELDALDINVDIGPESLIWRSFGLFYSRAALLGGGPSQ
jgi:hypothetical protein